MTLTDRIATFVQDLIFVDLPPAVVEAARRCLRDSLGCILGGAGSEPGRLATGLVRQMGGAPEATLVLGGGLRLPAPLAAFAHATMANALDFDDTLFGHPGATVVPAVLALGELTGADGRALVTALVAGYEVSVRVLACARPLIPRYEAMWDLGTLQTYGATAAAGKLLGLPQETLRTALGLAGATAPVPLGRKPRELADEGRSMIKSAYGWAVHSAILAARLAQSGFTAPAHIFDGTMGFWEVGPSPSARIAHFTDGLGERFLIEDVHFKPYPACRFIHPVLDGIREIVGAGVRGQAVRQIEIGAFHLLADEYHNIPRPRSVTDAQFSVPYCAAAMLVDGVLTPRAFTGERLRDPLESRGNAPRLYRNTLVFLAADRTRLQDLDEAVRRYLAWEEILVEKETLNLSPHQVRQAEEQKRTADGTVAARLPETYQWLLVPEQVSPTTDKPDPHAEVRWQTIRLTGNDALAVRASKKLRNEELLVTALAGTRLRMELDRVPLWRGDHVAIKQLIEDFARYLYLPRLKNPAVLVGAIRDGLALITWERESFAYAESFDKGAGRYRGLRAGQQVAVTEDDPGLLVKPEAARRQLDVEQRAAAPIDGPHAATATEAPSATAQETAAAAPAAAAPTRPKALPR